MDQDSQTIAKGKQSLSNLGVVIIGRNEGQRLITCLDSSSDVSTVVYVDSGSTDNSVQAARDRNVDVVELDMSIPFTAARARNMGFSWLLQRARDFEFVQFIDGDCELMDGWLGSAVAFLEARPDVAAVCGRLRERHPDRSIYNWLCDREWDRPHGEIRSCAGNAMIRAFALQTVGGYREDVVAGEEEELCVRLRADNWRIWRLSDEMGLHDAAMTNFDQWWKRSLRAGYAFAQGSHLHGAPPERLYVWETRRAFLWGLFLPAIFLTIAVAFFPFGLIVFAVYPMQVVRLILRNTGSFKDRARLAFFQLLARLPESLGQLKFWHDRLSRRRPQIIEYKR